MSEKYICKECGMVVIVLDNGEQLRPCGHKGAILLDMRVVCTGESITKIERV
jgi:hypothetical protein